VIKLCAWYWSEWKAKSLSPRDKNRQKPSLSTTTDGGSEKHRPAGVASTPDYWPHLRRPITPHKPAHRSGVLDVLGGCKTHPFHRPLETKRTTVCNAFRPSDRPPPRRSPRRLTRFLTQEGNPDVPSHSLVLTVSILPTVWALSTLVALPIDPD